MLKGSFLQHLFNYNKIAESNESNDAMDDGSDATTITEAQHNTVMKGNQRGKVLKGKGEYRK